MTTTTTNVEQNTDAVNDPPRHRRDGDVVVFGWEGGEVWMGVQ